MDITLNVNDWVWVQLTDEGIAHVRKYFESLFDTMTVEMRMRPFDMITEGTEWKKGWVELHLYELMLYFGDTMSNGSIRRMIVNDNISLTPPPPFAR